MSAKRKRTKRKIIMIAKSNNYLSGMKERETEKTRFFNDVGRMRKLTTGVVEKTKSKSSSLLNSKVENLRTVNRRP